MKKILLTSFIISLAIINCKAGNSTSPSDNKGGGDVQTKSWKVIGAENFSDSETADVVFTVSKKDNVPYVAYSSANSASSKAIAMMYDGSSWKYAGVKGFSKDAVTYLSMVATDDGSIYLSYRDDGATSGKTLSVAKFDGQNWIADIPDTTISEGDISYTSLVVNKNNIPFVAYVDHQTVDRKTKISAQMLTGSGNNRLWKNILNNAQYISDVSTGRVSTAIYNDNLYIVYENAFTSRISAKKYDINNNILTTLGKENITDNAVGNVNIAISDSGRIYIAYSDSVIDGGDTINVLEYNGSEWVQVGEKDFGQVDSRYFNAKRFFTVQGETPYIAFPDIENNNKVNVMKLENNSWTDIGERNFTSEENDYVNIAYSKDGTIYIAYANRDDGKITVMAYK